MKKWAFVLAVLAFTLPCGTGARAATGAELVDAVQTIVRTGLANVDSSFAPLRGAPIKQSPGEHYAVTKSFGEFFPECHISGYAPAQVAIAIPEWVFSCSTPGLGQVNVNQLRELMYEGVIRALPACFNRTLDPAVLRGEDFRWDCHSADHAVSVDVSTSPTSNGDPSFLLEVYEYVGAPAPRVTPAPSATPAVIQMVKPQATLDMGLVEVPYADYATLNLALHAALTPGTKGAVPHVVETVKAGNEMPAFDWAWHYAGKETQNGVQTISVWVCGNLSPREQDIALKQATLMGLLDSGLGGTDLQKAYTSARAADTALGPQSADPFANRRKLIAAMAKFF